MWRFFQNQVPSRFSVPNNQKMIRAKSLVSFFNVYQSKKCEKHFVCWPRAKSLKTFFGIKSLKTFSKKSFIVGGGTGVSIFSGVWLLGPWRSRCPILGSSVRVLASGELRCARGLLIIQKIRLLFNYLLRLERLLCNKVLIIPKKTDYPKK